MSSDTKGNFYWAIYIEVNTRQVRSIRYFHSRPLKSSRPLKNIKDYNIYYFRPQEIWKISQFYIKQPQIKYQIFIEIDQPHSGKSMQKF